MIIKLLMSFLTQDTVYLSSYKDSLIFDTQLMKLFIMVDAFIR